MVALMQCPTCHEIIGARSKLIHSRYCVPERSNAEPWSPRKRMKRRGMFASSSAVGMRPGPGVRRDDLCVMIAASEEEEENVGETGVLDGSGSVDRLSKALAPGVEQVPGGGIEWTAAASSEEVLEALRRVLLRVGVEAGAKTSDLILKLLHHPSFSIADLKTGIRTHQNVVKDADTDVEKSLSSLRFDKVSVADRVRVGTDAEAEMWVRDPVEVVRRQMAQLRVDAQEINGLYLKTFDQFDASGEPVISHPMSTDLAESVEARIRSTVMYACEANKPGVDGWEEGFDFVLFLQLYSDKSAQTLKTGSQTHFPIHVAPLNTSQSMKEKLIARGDCVVGYLPTSVTWEPEKAKAWATELNDVVSGQGSRISRLRILQAGVRRCLEPLLSKTVTGFEVLDSRGHPYNCHPVLWSYVTDLPEGWDISSTVHKRCSRCFVTKGDLASTRPSPEKEVTSVAMFYSELERDLSKRRKSIVKKNMWSKSMVSVRPYLLSLGENYGVDVYRCLRYETMHNIHLGLTRTLLECMSRRLKSTSFVSPEFKNKKGNNRTFNSIRTAVLRALNDSLELFDKHSPALDFRVSHRSGGKTTKLNGLFKDKGLASMLEAREYKRVLQVMPFLAATCDRLCGEPGTTTRLYVMYVELVFKITREKSLTACFSSADVEELRVSIARLMEAATELYGDHQASNMGLPKMHALMHVVRDIIEGGSLSHYRADAFESSHKNIKAAYNSGSRRGDEGHAEALGKMAREDFLRMASGKTARGARLDYVGALSKHPGKVRGARTSTKDEVLLTDSVALTRSGPVTHARVVQEFLRDLQRHGSLVRKDSVPTHIRQLISDVGGAHDFAWFMRKLALGPNDTISRSKSAYVSGFPIPVQEKSLEGKPMLVSVVRRGEGDVSEGKVERELQRVVSAHRFHNSKFPIQQTVMIEACDPKGTMEKLHKSVQGKYAACSVREVWIAKVVAFLCVKRRPVPGLLGVLSNERLETEEVALVQYFDLCDAEADDVESELKCPRLRWAREKDGDEETCQARGHYEVVSATTIRGFVHVVRGDYGLSITKTYRCQVDRAWMKTWFYINRFKLSGASLSLEDDEKASDDAAVPVTASAAGSGVVV